MQRAEAYSTHDRALEYLRERDAAAVAESVDKGEEQEDVRIAIAIEERGDDDTITILRIQTDNKATWRTIEEMRAAGVIPENARVEYIGRMRGLGPQDAVSPVQPGVSCAPDLGAAGTITCFATRDDVLFLVSANHVIAQENSAIRGVDGVVQPLAGSPGARGIAVLHDYVDLLTIGGNAMDSAVARVHVGDTNARLFNGRRIATVRQLPLLQGHTVRKLGAISGETSGRVLSTISNITLDMSLGSYQFDLHIEVETPENAPFAVAGDSGALVYDEADRAVGMLIGGNQTTRSYVTPIDRILAHFQMTLA